MGEEKRQAPQGALAPELMRVLGAYFVQAQGAAALLMAASAHEGYTVQWMPDGAGAHWQVIHVDSGELHAVVTQDGAEGAMRVYLDGARLPRSEGEAVPELPALVARDARMLGLGVMIDGKPVQLERVVLVRPEPADEAEACVLARSAAERVLWEKRSMLPEQTEELIDDVLAAALPVLREHLTPAPPILLGDRGVVEWLRSDVAGRVAAGAAGDPWYIAGRLADALEQREEYRAVTADDPGGANSPLPAMPGAEVRIERVDPKVTGEVDGKPVQPETPAQEGRVGHSQVLAWLEGLPVSTREWAMLFPDEVLHDSLLPQVIAEASGRVPLSINSREDIAGIVRERRSALDDGERRGAAAEPGSGAGARAGAQAGERAGEADLVAVVEEVMRRAVKFRRPAACTELSQALVRELWDRGLVVKPGDEWPFVHYCRSSLREIGEVLSGVELHEPRGGGVCADCAEAVRQAREFAQRTLGETVPAEVERGEDPPVLLVLRPEMVRLLRALTSGEPHVCTCSEPDIVDAAAVSCPTCDARIYWACVGEDGRALETAHVERAQKARAELGGGCSVGSTDRCRHEETLRQLVGLMR